jgi:hypothetical protein
MKPTLHPILSTRNRHPRDANIQFFEEGHRYTILTDPDSKYTSVTTWNHAHFPQFDADDVIQKMMNGRNWKVGHKYWGMTPEQIKAQWEANRDAVAGAGTDLHFDIECFYNYPKLDYAYTHKDLYHSYIRRKEAETERSLEWQYFIQFVKDHPDLKPYRTEWTVYDEDIQIAGSIDMVFEHPDGTLAIYDWKRAKAITRINTFNKFAVAVPVCHFPDSNFWHYALQLNTYKYILETKYGHTVKDLYLVRLHPEAEEKSYELIALPDLSTEIRQLVDERRKGVSTKKI